MRAPSARPRGLSPFLDSTQDYVRCYATVTAYFNPTFYDGSYSAQWNAVRGYQHPIATGYPRAPIPMVASSAYTPIFDNRVHYSVPLDFISYDEAVPKPKTPQTNPTGYRSRKEKARANREEHKRRAKRGK